jgi:hypothetical protein
LPVARCSSLARPAARPREQPDQHADRSPDQDVQHPRFGQPPVHWRNLREDQGDNHREQTLSPAQAQQRPGREADQHHDRQGHRVDRRVDADDEQARHHGAQHRADESRTQGRAGLGGRRAQHGEDREQHPKAVRQVQHAGE